MSSLKHLQSLKFSKYFPNNLEYDASKVYNAEVFPSPFRPKTKKKSKKVKVHRDTPKGRLPLLSIKKLANIDIIPEQPKIPEPLPPPPEPSPPPPQASDKDAKQKWEDIEKCGKPRIVISVIGAYNERIPSYKWKHQMLLRKSLNHVARYAGKCGLIFNEEDMNFVQNIVRNKRDVQGLKSIVYGFASNTSTTNTSNDDKNATVKEPRTVLLERLKLENYINLEGRAGFEKEDDVGSGKNEIRIPVVLLVLNGELDTLEHVIRAIDNNISVVVVKGTGGTADLVALCMKDMNKLKRKLPIMFSRRFSDDMYEKMKQVLDRILQKEWMITVFNIKKNKHDELWGKITDGILRSWSFEKKEDDVSLTTDPILPSQINFISKYVSNIDGLSRKELFAGYHLQPTSEKNKNYHQHTFVNAFLGKRTDIIQQVLSVDAKFTLAEDQFQILCHEVVKSITSKTDNGMNGFILVESVYPEAFTYLKEGKGSGFKNARDAVIKISNKLLQGICFSKLGMVTCCKTDATKPREIKPNAEIPVIESLRVAVISNHVKLAAELWSQCENPLLTALVAHTYLIAMADKAESLYEEELQKNLLSHSRKFLSRAIKLLDKLFQKDEEMATKALDYTSEVWGLEEKPLHFGHQFNLEEFISHPSAQKDASKRLFPYESTQQRSDIDTKKNENLSRECTAFIKHHLHWKSTWKFVTAPIIKLVANVVFFVTTLVLFSYFLTRDLNTKISVLEVVLFFYMVGDLLEQLWSMVRPQDGNWSPQRILLYLFNLWNMLDLFCVILYIAGFALHYFDPEMLTHTRRIYSVALFIMFLRLLNVLLLIKRIGIIIIMIKEMLVDLVEYLVILILFMLAAGIVYQANIYPNHTVTAFPSNIWNWQIWSILKIPYWQVYGELYLDVIEGSDDPECTDNATLWKNDPSFKRCPTSDLIPPVIAATYMMLTNWLLLNIVIAMFSARFDLIKEKSSQKWRYHRHAVVIEYEHKIPSPLNIPFRVLTILCLAPCLLCPSCKDNDITGTTHQIMLNAQREFAKDIIGRERDRDHMK
ncbi:transient receptor potential cation channel subfamily M member 2-like [Mytilus californianus]|uniref:transient receptor potential cation channel subfamily M member 2-like n=1 Tax=Mytilus californianus TaxID=6549 RepID=UPI0022453A29|nr:transient receptor potential cation channel subfamily M member 2-like [Mytilus californianus]